MAKWDNLPAEMRCDEVRRYYDILAKRKFSLLFKRLFDIVVASILLIMLSPVFAVLSLLIVLDSRGGVFFRQSRVTTNGRTFRIFKFRSMVANAEKIGSQVTTSNDMRVTRMGKLLRGCRLDEIPQLLNILTGDMTFVGTRPEVIKYVERYTPEMRATLLLPAGVTSEASIYYKDESELLDKAANVDDVYVNEVLPGKMKYNLAAIENFSFVHECLVMVKTVLAVCGVKV